MEKKKKMNVENKYYFEYIKVGQCKANSPSAHPTLSIPNNLSSSTASTTTGK